MFCSSSLLHNQIQILIDTNKGSIPQPQHKVSVGIGFSTIYSPQDLIKSWHKKSTPVKLDVWWPGLKANGLKIGNSSASCELVTLHRASCAQRWPHDLPEVSHDGEQALKKRRRRSKWGRMAPRQRVWKLVKSLKTWAAGNSGQAKATSFKALLCEPLNHFFRVNIPFRGSTWNNASTPSPPVATQAEMEADAGPSAPRLWNAPNSLSLAAVWHATLDLAFPSSLILDFGYKFLQVLTTVLQ